MTIVTEPVDRAGEQRARLTVADGRVLEVYLTGWQTTPDDAPVLVHHHGTPGCGRLSQVLRAGAATLGLRVICPTRPGYGGSTRRPGRDVAAVADDVRQVLDALGVTRAVVTGESGGGPHALATAALLPDRCPAVATLAGVGPHGVPELDFTAGMGQDNIEEFGAARDGETTLRPYLDDQRVQLAGVSAETIAQGLASLLPPVDRALVTGAMADDIVSAFTEALAPGVDGWLDDDLAFVRPWGFDLAALRSARVFIWQGDQDLMVPAAHGRWLCRAIPGAQPRLSPDDGHLSIAHTRLAQVLGELLAALG